jgi:hypothetical protein
MAKWGKAVSQLLKGYAFPEIATEMGDFAIYLERLRHE